MQNIQTKYRRFCRQYLNLTLLFLTLILNNQGFCQELQNISLFGGAGSDAFTVISHNECQVIIGGTFGEIMSFGGETLVSLGKGDIFCGSINGDEEQLITHGGSSEIDALTAIVNDSQNNSYLAGSFIGTATFQDSTLQAGPPNNFASFISKYDEKKLLWSMVLNGNTFEEVTDMVVDEFDNIYVTGYFGESLIIDNHTSISTEADVASFLFKMNNEGEILWIHSYGLTGSNRAEELSYCQEKKQLFISGNYKGELDFGETVIKTNTSDNDIFIASVDTDGNPLWLIKAGGVYEDVLIDMIASEVGDVFLTGNFRGIIDIDDQLEIRTQGSLDDNFFVMKLNHEGVPQWARSLGEQAYSESGLALFLSPENELFLSGITTGSLNIDGISFPKNEAADVSMFVSSFNESTGDMNWIIGPEDATGIILPDVMQMNECGELFVGGGIRGMVYVQNEWHESNSYDCFLAKVNLEPNSIMQVEQHETAKIYPNPNDGCHFLDLNERVYYAVYDINGVMIFEKEIFAGEEICLEGEFSGLFFWTSVTKKGFKNSGRMIIEK